MNERKALEAVRDWMLSDRFDDPMPSGSESRDICNQVIKALQSDYREPDETTPEDAAVRYRWPGIDKRWYLSTWAELKRAYTQDPTCVTIIVLDQGPPPDDWKPTGPGGK